MCLDVCFCDRGGGKGLMIQTRKYPRFLDLLPTVMPASSTGVGWLCDLRESGGFVVV